MSEERSEEAGRRIRGRTDEDEGPEVEGHRRARTDEPEPDEAGRRIRGRTDDDGPEVEGHRWGSH